MGRRSGDLIFKTPPTQTGHTVSPSPIEPGKTLKGFRFYLTGKTKTHTIFFSYDDGTNSPPLRVDDVGGENVTVSDSDEKTAHIPRQGTIICTNVVVTAPKEKDASDIHFTGLAEVTAPPGWHSSMLDEKTGTFVLETDYPGPPLAKGKALVVQIYVKEKGTNVKWKLTDAEHNDIPGASGSVYIQ